MNHRQNENNQPSNGNDQKQADRVFAILNSAQEPVDETDRDLQEFGRLLKESAASGLPKPNPELREQLCERLDAQVDQFAPHNTPVEKPIKPASKRRWRRPAIVMALTAALGIAVLAGIGSNRFLQIESPMAFTSQSANSPDYASPANENYTNAIEGSPPANLSHKPFSRNGSRDTLPSSALKGAPLPAIPSDASVAGSKSKQRGPQLDGQTNNPNLPKVDDVRSHRTVNVPDGGTVKLGGIKRSTPQKSSEQRGANANRRFASNSNSDLSFYYRIPRLRGESIRPNIDHLFTIVDDRKGFYEQRHYGLDFGDTSDRFSSESYDPIIENEFLTSIGESALSTFSIDVDTASYSNMRRFINRNQPIPRNSVRIEELINYFQYDYPQPKGDDPFSVNLEIANCPWNRNHQLLRIGIKGKDIDRGERPPSNIVFLVDVSGSMNSADKLALLKRGLMMMLDQLTENDRISIVTYAGVAGVQLHPTSGDQKRKIGSVIEGLGAGGSTNGSAGIAMAYQLASQNFIEGGTNRVILATDGDLNVGVTADQELVSLIKEKSTSGVFLTVLGFGTGNLKDSKMEKLADNGNGMYAYIDNMREAHKVLVQQMSGSLVTIAKDVKIQLEFNPAEVKSYRLIGYENRVMANQDFDNDKIDAGEIGAGHSVTALYELVPTNGVEPMKTSTKKLKYQQTHIEPTPNTAPNGLTDASRSGEVMTVSLRYKKPDGHKSRLIEMPVSKSNKNFYEASREFQFAAAVASFGMLLRNSAHRGNSTFDEVEKIASGAIGDDTSGYRSEFVDLVRRVNSKN